MNLLRLAGLLSLIATDMDSRMVKPGDWHKLTGVEALAIAATTSDAAKHFGIPLSTLMVEVREKDGVVKVSWGHNDANVRGGGYEYELDPRTLKILRSYAEE